MSTPTTGARTAQGGGLTIQWTPKSLDPWQQAAAESPVGPVFLVGAPGTGKTHTLVARVAGLVVAGADPRSIVVLTKTVAAAEAFAVALAEVPEVPELTGRVADIFIGIFQAYASSFVRQVGAEVLGIPPNYTLWGPDQCVHAVKQLAAEYSNAEEEARISHGDVHRLLAWHSLNRARTDLDPIPAPDGIWHKLADGYTAEKRRQQVLDWDDLTEAFAITLRDHHAVRDAWRQHRVQHLLIDDFQDITATQYDLVRLLTGPGGSITVAADPNSGVLSGRGGDRWLTKRFLMDHREASRHLLPLNHRATKSLSNTAAALQASSEMSGVETMDQTPVRIPGKPPILFVHHGPIATLDQTVLDIVQDHFNNAEYDWHEMAILYPDANAARRITAGLRNRGIPCRDVGRAIEPSAPDRLVVQNLLAIALNPRDAVAWLNAVAAGLSSSQHRKLSVVMRGIREVATQHGGDQLRAARRYVRSASRSTVITRRLRFIVNTTPILQEMMAQRGTDIYSLTGLAHAQFRENGLSNPPPQPSADLQRFFALVEAFADPTAPLHTQLFKLLDHLAIASDPMQRSLVDNPHGHGRAITLSPIHRSQGHQWRVVCLLDCVDEQMPGRHADGDEERLHEAQRLFHVAVTRAEDRLYICCPLVDANCMPQTRSRFIASLGPILEGLGER